MHRLALAGLVGLAGLAGCAPKASDSVGDTGPAGYVSSIGECERQVGEWPLESGDFQATVEVETVNNCENAKGQGYHVNEGATNLLVLVTDDNCLSADADGMAMEGWMSDTQVALEGVLQDEQGLCIIELVSTIWGEVTSNNQFTYEITTTATPLDPTCDMMVGDKKGHTFGQLPCEFGWTGAAILAD